jgi:hypothetical protein
MSDREMSDREAGTPPPDGTGGERRPPSPEELAAAMARQLGQIPVRDLVLQSMATFADVAGIRLGLGPEGDARRDLAQARHAIECLRALIGVAEQELGAAAARPFREPLAQLQLIYARLAEGGEAAAGPAAPGQGSASGPATPGSEPPPGGAARRLWVPPHYRR